MGMGESSQNSGLGDSWAIIYIICNVSLEKPRPCSGLDPPAIIKSNSTTACPES